MIAHLTISRRALDVLIFLFFIQFSSLLATSPATVHFFDLNETASSEGVIGGTEGGEEVQSRPMVQTSTQGEHFQLGDLKGWGGKRPRGVRQAREQNHIVPTTNKRSSVSDQAVTKRTGKKGRPLIITSNDSDCETHKPGCDHWDRMTRKERNRHSSRRSMRRKLSDPKFKEIARKRKRESYSRIDKSVVKQKNQNRWIREKKRREFMSEKELAEVVAKHREAGRKYERNKRAKMLGKVNKTIA